MTSFLKRFLSIILTTAIIAVYLTIPVFSASVDNLESAILTVKEKIEIPDSLTEFDSNIRNTDKLTQYYLNWYSNNNAKSIDVCVNSFGDIINYSINGVGYDNNAKFSKYTKEDIIKISTDFLKSINPDWLSDLTFEDKGIQFSENIYNNTSHIYFKRYINNIPFLNDGVNLTINNLTGEIIYMNSTWTYPEGIASPSGVLSADDAMRKFYEKAPLSLIYKMSGDKTAALIYDCSNPQLKISAIDATVLQTSPMHLYGAEAEDSVASMGANKNELSESEMKNVIEVNDLLSQQKLTELAQSITETGLEKAELISCEYARAYLKNPDDTPRYRAELSFVFNKGSDNEYHGFITFDAQDGALLQYHSYNYRNYDNKTEPKISRSSAEKTANTFIKKYAPEKAPKTTLSDSKEDGYVAVHSFNYIRTENSIPFPENYIYVGIDSESGYICEFYTNWNKDITFESAENLLSAEEANIFFGKNIGIELSYINTYPDENGSEPLIALAYGLCAERGTAVNAKDGSPVLNYTEDTVIYPIDISDHYAKDIILKLIDTGMLSVNSDDPAFRPNDTITYRELVSMVSRLKIRYPIWELSELTSFMRGNSILHEDESFNPDAFATRLDGPLYILRALGYRQVAELDIYSQSFNDWDTIPKDKAGYVALAKGLKIINGDENGCFNANDSLTRADAAIMIYNYLSR